MAKYRNKKNGRVMEIIQEDKKYKTLLVRFEDDDSETEISTSTLKRWYEELDEDDDEYEDEDEEQEEDDEDYDEDEDEDSDEDEEDDSEDDEEDDDDSEDDEEDEEELDDEEEDEEDDDSEEDSDEDDEESEDDDDEDVDDEEEDEEEDDEDEEEEPAPKKGKSSSKKAPKAKEKKPATPRKKSEESDDVKQLVEYVEECVKEQDGEIFQPQSQPRNRAFKVGGHMYARLLYSVKSVTVACRKEAVSKVGIKPTKTINHMFSELYAFEKLDKTAKANIKKLLQASFDYQMKKNQGSDKTKAKKEKAAPAKEKKAAKTTGKKTSKKEK